jgi:hypothetical protein
MLVEEEGSARREVRVSPNLVAVVIRLRSVRSA